ncbi:hypothetical protein [Brachyspira innocens]|uniref:hypothetical protein n=1 Tax=Brachyspira innocens TaxID=13264 RepID=UPI0026F0ED05|nr:hypothetical protein [Brachyspira innocens]
MDKTISKYLTIKIIDYDYCSNKCPLSIQDGCCKLYHSEKRTKDYKLNLYYRLDFCKEYFQTKTRREKSFLYQIENKVFYEVGYKAKNIKEAAKLLGTSESNLKSFIYYIDNRKYKDKDLREQRVKKAISFLDGRHQALIDKIKRGF